MIISPQHPTGHCMSLSINITLFACIAHRLASSNRFTTYASATSCTVRKAVAWNCNPPALCCWAISLTHHANGSFQMRKLIHFWNLQISHRATVQGLHLLPFFVGTPDVFLFHPPTFFLLSSSLASLSPSRRHFPLHPIFLSQIYLLLFMYSTITLTIPLLVLFPLR